MSFKLRAKHPATAASSDGDASALAAAALPAGVMLSPQTAGAITSWGLRAMDVALGGGLPLGSLTLVAEDRPTAFHVPLLSYVTAQGLRHGHAVAVASCVTPSAEAIVRALPACVEERRATPAHGGGADTAEMKIAWRYGKTAAANGAPRAIVDPRLRSFTSDFDLSQPSTLPAHAALSCLPLDLERPLATLLEHVTQHIHKAAQRGLLSRVIVHGVTSALCDRDEHWDRNRARARSDDDDEHDMSVTEFLVRLRALVRVFDAVAVASCAPDVASTVLRTASDALLFVDSFDGRGAGVAGLGAEWLGVVIVKKTYRHGYGASLRGRGDVWVFKRGRRKYAMERATAAPDDDEGNDADNMQDASVQAAANASGICGSGPASNDYEF